MLNSKCCPVLRKDVKNMSSTEGKNIKEAKASNPNPDVYGVVGVCGVVGNMLARMLIDHNCKVLGTDINGKDNCEYIYTLRDYNLPLYLSEHPEAFFKNSTFIVPPPSLGEDSELCKKIKNYGLDILTVDDCLKKFKPEKPVLCITGTNGKTTTTTLLKHICRSAGLNPSEHGFRNLQGNIDYIPPLQARLNGDVAVLETGTFGNRGDIKKLVERCEPDCGILTNINPDHLDKNHDFMNYARIKGEFVDYFKNKKLIVNSDDPTAFGLVDQKTDFVTFGIDSDTFSTVLKRCWCGRDIELSETITGSGVYSCECGLNRPEPDFLATEIDETHGRFKLRTPESVLDVEMKLIGLHNVYNTIGAIAAAREFFEIPYDDIIRAVESFEGVPGRIEYLFSQNGMDIIIDYGHNPAGIETVLREIKKVYKHVTVVITVSSESGESGDREILKKTMELADFIVPASFASRMAAEKHEEYISSGKIIFTDISLKKFQKGTLGATSDQVLEGLKKGLECNTSVLVCLGEAAFKYKENIIKLKDLKS
jgi:UDP-N-acetylmuramate--alanine ligase